MKHLKIRVVIIQFFIILTLIATFLYLPFERNQIVIIIIVTALADILFLYYLFKHNLILDLSTGTTVKLEK